MVRSFQSRAVIFRSLVLQTMVNNSVSARNINELHSAAQKHSFHALLVIAAHQGGVVEIAFLRCLLLGKNVTVISVLSLDFTRAGESETLLGTCFSF